jgi:hypothetical protein
VPSDLGGEQGGGSAGGAASVEPHQRGERLEAARPPQPIATELSADEPRQRSAAAVAGHRRAGRLLTDQLLDRGRSPPAAVAQGVSRSAEEDDELRGA